MDVIMIFDVKNQKIDEKIWLLKVFTYLTKQEKRVYKL